MKKTLTTLIVTLLLVQATLFIITPISAEQKEIQDYVPNELIVKFKVGVSENEVASIASSHGLSVISKSQYTGVHKIKVPHGKTMFEFAEKLRRNPNIEYAEPNLVYQACMIPNDPIYSYQWHLHDINEGGINMEPAWDISTGSGATIAIVDTGISKDGSDLTDANILTGYDFVNNDNDATDDNGHGTHCAGTAAQSTNNNNGVCGVAFNAKLLPVKVLDSGGSGSVYDVADGIIWAADNGANIISLSLSGGAHYTLETAVNYAYNAGVTVVAASGNDYSSSVAYPAAYVNAVAVGATKYDKLRCSYSNYGSALDIVAPGGDLYYDQNNDGYGDGVLQETFSGSDWAYYFFDGTSMATPHVAGTAALLYANGVTTPDSIREAIQNSAVDLGPTGWDPDYGHGLLNAYNALTYNTGNSPPTADFTYSTSLLTITFTDQSTDSDGTIASWSWDFGDGTTSTAQNPSHTYATGGTYTVSLTVTDNEGATDSTSQDVTVSSGVLIDMHIQDVYLWLAGNAGPWEHIGVQATIVDAGNNPVQGVLVDISLTTPAGGSLSGTATTDSSGIASIVFEKASRTSGLYTGTITGMSKSGYTWDTSADIETSDTFDSGGGGTTNNPPNADFSYTTSVLTAYFTDDSSDSDGTIVNWNWDFGDSTTATAQNPSHTYATDGTYTVTLTVTDDDGATDTTSQDVTVSTGSGSDIILTATGYKIKGRQHADLSWSGVTGAVNILRDGIEIASDVTGSTYTDYIGNVGGGSYTYQIYDISTGTLSNEATVTF